MFVQGAKCGGLGKGGHGVLRITLERRAKLPSRSVQSGGLAEFPVPRGEGPEIPSLSHGV